MSSAILYVAIIAIWACVLIPRWLRRDSARGASGTASETVPDDMAAGTDGTVAGTDGTADSGTGGRSVSAGGTGGRSVSAGGPAAGVNPGWLSARVETAERREPPAPQLSAPEPPSNRPPSHRPPFPRLPAPEEPADEARADESPLEEAPPSLTPEETRHRMLAARRRLLGMLLVLEAAAIALAMLGLAALWVVVPPTVMLAGYLLVLREAAHADVERAAHDQEAARARARAQEQASARDRARAAQRPPAAMAPAGVPATPAAPAAPAAGYEEAVPGRDFAPGLAGKYTTSNADAIDGSDERGDERYLRAVGD